MGSDATDDAAFQDPASPEALVAAVWPSARGEGYDDFPPFFATSLQTPPSLARHFCCFCCYCLARLRYCPFAGTRFEHVSRSTTCSAVVTTALDHDKHHNMGDLPKILPRQRNLILQSPHPLGSIGQKSPQPIPTDDHGDSVDGNSC